MYLNINIEDIEDKLGDMIKICAEEQIEKQIKENPELLQQIVKESVKGAIKVEINRIMQTKDYKEYLRDKVMEYLKNDD